ncbi:MAG TPA: GNAT family N-acetyltransferase [Acidimicrobiales bacterium]|nr:GNAT family N-acetyltransferase [Acidimicrobiales bacterium]
MNADTAVAPFRETFGLLRVEAARRATTEDQVALVALLGSARSELVDKRGGQVLALRDNAAHDLPAYVETCLSSQEMVVAIGTFDKVPMGFGLMRTFRAADDAIHAVIKELFVEPEARSVGIGEALLMFMLDAARKRNALGIEALALPGDRETKNFFETQGMSARALVVHRWLDDR